ncbi:hypothetical protein C8T65DRAFT_107348 [Cerioporus squamosus]|nr:hypothetical protein C8T65DRAFT_107348 [Cerioporus squamosus]
MERWKLHLDILLNIIAVADLETKSRMVKTCHILHREGGKTMLRSTDMELYTRRQIASFLLFMRADAPGRFRSLRVLCLNPLLIRWSLRCRSRHSSWSLQIAALHSGLCTSAGTT